MSRGSIKLAPSILSADFANLGPAVAAAESNGADSIHVDIMDGRFVPSVTWGPKTVEALKKWTNLPLDVHMMVSEPEKQINDYINAGADVLTVHSEATAHIHHIIESIKSRNAKAGLAINPGTPISAVEEILGLLDQVLVMTVNPGLPGQKYIVGSENKISAMRSALNTIRSHAELEVDGGINPQTARLVAESGASTLVAGSAIFDHPDGIAEAIRSIRQNLE